MDKNKKDYLYQIVSSYGENPISYHVLEDDKNHFLVKGIEGVIAYAVVGEVLVISGDIVASEKQAAELLSEFTTFAKKNNYSLLFSNTTEKFLELYKNFGFETIKYGEEALFKLADYNLKGGKVAKVRAAINHANKAGIEVSEYKPKEKRDPELENEILELSKEWFKIKKGGEIKFSLGGIGLTEPYDRRYFTAKNSEGKLLSFVVFIPYAGKKGYLAEITRRLPDAPQGAIEKIIYEAFMVFKSEGAEWGSLGLIPLVNVREEDIKNKLTTRIFEYIYENMNYFYGFKNLYHAKKKYSPTDWEPRYLVYYPKRFTPQLAYALLKVKKPKILKNYLLPMLKKGIIIK
ncbi:MAG: bifunctional lysylphosphatidylglycerol flippase/synthetase MprF [Halanaerobium sp.]